MNFNKIVTLCEKHGFLHKIFNSATNLETFKIGPVGALLQENLHQEWFNSVVINKDIQVFVNESEFSETFKFAKETCLNVMPFGVAQLLDGRLEINETEGFDFRNYFEKFTIFECRIFVNSSNAMQFFHQWQRERRRWWRKFSNSPGRYTFNDIKNGEIFKTVEIVAKYPWGDQLVENLSMIDEPENVADTELQSKNAKKTIQTQCVVSRINSSSMLLNTLCDAYDELPFQDTFRPLLRLHRKLAPYKISFAISSGPKSVVDDLKDLALYLCRQIRKNHLSCLLVPSSHKNTLETQWKQYDQMGIPYNILLNENTLKTGIAQLRSRDTTLKEQVHVTDLPGYLEKIFKNYELIK